MKKFGIRSKRLDNGVRVLYVRDNDKLSAYVGVMCLAGSNYERNDEAGVAHLIEHMMFRGSENLKDNEFARLVEGSGAINNAYTSFRTTMYYTYGNADKYDYFLELLGDLYMRPKFDAEALGREKGVVLSEIDMYNDDKRERAVDLFYDEFFKSTGDRFGKMILGDKEFIANAKPDNLFDFYNRYYIPENTVIVIAGNVRDFDEVMDKVNKVFGDWRKDGVVVDYSRRVAVENDGGFKYWEDKDANQAHIKMALQFDPDLYFVDDNMVKVELLETALGGGMSSFLFDRIRNKLGTGYYVGARYSYIGSDPVFDISMGVDTDRVLDVVKETYSIIDDIRNSGVGGELESFKEYYRGIELMTLERLSSVVSKVLDGVFNRGVEAEDVDLFKMVNGIAEVGNEDVKEVSNKIFSNKMLVGVYGNVDKGVINEVEKIVTERTV